MENMVGKYYEVDVLNMTNEISSDFQMHVDRFLESFAKEQQMGFWEKRLFIPKKSQDLAGLTLAFRASVLSSCVENVKNQSAEVNPDLILNDLLKKALG